MLRPSIVLPPYPVQIGSIRFDSPERQLHEYVRHGKYSKAKKMLKKGILPDSVNSEGQTPLFVASLLGLRKIVDLLLEYGSSPNHRCFDWSTPVHAAAFSCNQWVMSSLIDAGGDLRLHDEKCRRPYDWALMAATDHSTQMLEFIDRCSARMDALIHLYDCKSTKTVTWCDLLTNTSTSELQSPRTFPNSLLEKNKRPLVKTSVSLGYGELYVSKTGHFGLASSFPLIEDKNIMQDDSKPLFSFPAGPYMTMTNLMWGCTEVTVKGLSEVTHKHCNNVRYADLLMEELKIISNLHHPLILQLLAICCSTTMERTQLVFEKVTFGSFHSVLHKRRSEFPILHMDTIVHILLQTIDALMFLHWRGFVHCSFSSHAIQIVSAGSAKISHFEYMIQSNDDWTQRDGVYFPIPEQLYPWSSPEIVLRRNVSVKSDIYSLCVVIQESLTDCLPWNGLDGSAVKDSMASDCYLDVDPRLTKPYDGIVSSGLQAKPRKRTMTLQDIKYLLHNDLKETLDAPANASRMIRRCSQHSEEEGQLGYIEELIATTYKARKTSFFNLAESVSSAESHTDTLDETTKGAMSVHSDSESSEGKGNSSTDTIDQQDFGSSSAVSSQILEKSSNSDSEHDTGYEVWKPKFHTVEEKLPSLQPYTKSTKGDSFHCQTLQQSKKVLAIEETNPQPEDVSVWQPLKTGTDEVDHMVQHFRSLAFAERPALGPPHLHYVPPVNGSCLHTDVYQTEKTPWKTSPKITVGDWNKTVAQEQSNLRSACAQNTETDASSEAEYFTPELELSQREDSQESSGDESNTTDEDVQQTTITEQEHRPSVCWAQDTNMTSISSFLIDVEGLSSISEDKTKNYSATKSKDGSARHSTPVGQVTRSRVISPGESRNSLETSRWTSFGSHQSTSTSVAFSPAKGERSDAEKADSRDTSFSNQDLATRSESQTSWKTSCWASLGSQQSTLSSETFFSAKDDGSDVEKIDLWDASFRNQDLVCIVGAEDNILNKTDCECRSMDLSTILSQKDPVKF